MGDPGILPFSTAPWARGIMCQRGSKKHAAGINDVIVIAAK
jgi:hypothetical protein